MDQKYIAWFSCGVPSAVAAWMALKDYGKDNVRVIRQDTGSEHPDHERFMAECSEWLGVDIEMTKSKKYNNVDDVIEKTSFISSNHGARCTGELKKIPAQDAISWGRGQEIEIFGYTIEEQGRIEAWVKNNSERKIDPILIRHGLSRADCNGIISKIGIKRSLMYELGFNNSNCLGCVKGGAGYWNLIRKHFPDVFLRRSKQERALRQSMLKVERSRKHIDDAFDWPEWVTALSSFDQLSEYSNGLRAGVPVYLDELPVGYGDHKSEPAISCGLFCQLAL